jgi:tetratricopeptide (TPR) repeat protein
MSFHATVCLMILLQTLVAQLDPRQGSEGGRVDDLIAEADRAFQEGRIEEAVKAYEAVLKIDPGNLKALQMAGYIRYHAMDFTDAERHFQAAFDPEEPSYYPLLMLGNIALQRFRLLDAFDYYQRARALNAEDATLKENIRLTEERIERARTVAVHYQRSSLVLWIGSILMGGVLLLAFTLEIRPKRRRPASSG